MTKDNIKEFSETKMIGIGILWDRPMLNDTYSHNYIKYLEVEDTKNNRLYVRDQLEPIKHKLENELYLAFDDKLIRTADVLIVDIYEYSKKEVKEEE